MRGSVVLPILAAALVAGSGRAAACRFSVPLDLADATRADAIVEGRILNYEIVLDKEARERRARWLATEPDMSPTIRELLENQKNFVTDYASFDLQVDTVLKGQVPARFTVSWNNSTFPEPEAMPDKRYLIALRNEGHEPGTYSPVQAACSGPLMVAADSAEAKAMRGALRP